MTDIKHYSDCAVHNEPALPAGECNCGWYRKMSDEYFTVIFKGDIRDLSQNPLKIASQFGEVAACGMGNAFDETEELRAENEKLREVLKPFAELKPVSWSLENDHYFIGTDDIRAAADAIKVEK